MHISNNCIPIYFLKNDIKICHFIIIIENMDIIKKITDLLPNFNPDEKLQTESKTQLVKYVKKLKNNLHGDNLKLADELILVAEKNLVNKKIKEEIVNKATMLIKNYNDDDSDEIVQDDSEEIDITANDI